MNKAKVLSLACIVIGIVWMNNNDSARLKELQEEGKRLDTEAVLLATENAYRRGAIYQCLLDRGLSTNGWSLEETTNAVAKSLHLGQ